MRMWRPGGRPSAALAALTLAALVAASPAAADPAGKTTLEETILAGGGTNFKQLRIGPGEPYTVRRDMIQGQSNRARRRRSMFFFGQLTDPQLADEMSPARIELVDPAGGQISAAWRPQEALGPWVFDAQIRNMNLNRVSPVRQGNGARNALDFAILTGDFADSQQFNEVNWFRDVLEGRRFSPFSGKPISASNPCSTATPADVTRINDDVANRRYTGVQDYDDYPGVPARYPGFWDPDTPAASGAYSTRFPSYPGLVNTAQRSLTPAGLRVPWYISRGNHDALVQGNAPANLGISGLTLGSIATGCIKFFPSNALDPAEFTGLTTDQLFARLTSPAFLAQLFAGAHPVAPDPDRRYVSKAAYKSLMGTRDNRHGYAFVNAAENRASNGNATYYAFTRGQLRFVSLDSNAEGGVASGNIDDPQYKWLERELDRFSSVEIRNGRVVRDGDRQNKLFVISSHHTIETMNNPVADEAAGVCTNPLEPGCDSDPRRSTPIHQGEDGNRPLLDLLLRYPNVIAYVNGHTHHNDVRAFERPTILNRKGQTFRGGFWQINTASHVDWPQQSRTIEFMDNRDRTLSIFGTVLNTSAPIRPPAAGTAATGMSNSQLASLSRQVAANDPQTRDVTEGGGLGQRQDRNVELLTRDPRVLWGTGPIPPPPPPPFTG